MAKSNDLREVGEKIRFYRKEKNLTQLQLAELSGYTPNTIYLIESAGTEMKLQKLFDIAQALEVAPDKLMPERFYEFEKPSNMLFEIEHG